MMERESDGRRRDEGKRMESSRSAGNRRFFWGGCVLAIAAFVSYFGWTLQRPGSAGLTWIHELLAVVGVFIAGVASWRGRRRWLSWVGVGIVGLSAFLLVAYVHVISSRLPSIEGVVEVGRQAPDFYLAAADGRYVRLEEFRGKPLVLVFYRGYW